MEAIGAGATYPTIYNDEVNIPAVSYGMRIDEKTLENNVNAARKLDMYGIVFQNRQQTEYEIEEIRRNINE